MIDHIVSPGKRKLVPYLSGLEQQRTLHAAVVEGRAPNTVMLLEHESVYTAGKRTAPHEHPTDGTPVVQVDRGGKITWHGPGQLVGYPILRLPDPVDVVAYVRRLEGMLMAVLADLGVHGAERVPGRSGVWVRGSDKVAAIGIRVAQGVTMHGFALNCSNSFDPYRTIVACGLADAGVTSVSRELGRTVTPEDVVPLIRHHFGTLVVEPGIPDAPTTDPARRTQEVSA